MEFKRCEKSSVLNLTAPECNLMLTDSELVNAGFQMSKIFGRDWLETFFKILLLIYIEVDNE